MSENQIKVLVKYPYKEAKVVTIENTLKTKQEIVGGYIEIVSFPTVEGVDLVVNEEGKLDRLEGNFWLPHHQDCAVGPAIILAHDDEGDAIGLTDEQIKSVQNYIDTFKIEEGFCFYQNFHMLNACMKNLQKDFDKKHEGEM